MPFLNRTLCHKCNETFDALEESCPKCHERNGLFDQLKISDKAFNTSFAMQILLFVLGFIGLNFLMSIVQIICMGVLGNDESVLADVAAISSFISYSALFIIILIILIKSFPKLVKIFKDKKGYLIGLAGLGIIFAFSIFWSRWIGMYGISGDNANQSIINEVTLKYPIPSILVLGLIGPFVEEMTYRVGLFHFFRRINKKLAYLIAVFAFAFIHFDISSLLGLFQGGDVNSFVVELANFPVYLFSGFVLTYLYDKYGLHASWTAHALNNVLSLVLILVGSNV